MWETVERVLLTALKSALGQTLPLLLPLLIFGWLIHLSSNFLEKNVVRLLGLNAYLYLIGWAGTLVHELGHAIFCPLFGHRVTGMRLFSLSTRTKSAGFVSHSYNSRNPYHLIGNLFISIGPLVLGSLVIYLSLRYLAGLPLYFSRFLAEGKTIAPAGGAIGKLKLFSGALWAAGQVLAENVDLTDWRTYTAAYLVLSIGSAMTLSREDITSAASGLGYLLLLVFGLNLVLAAAGIRLPGAMALLPWTAAVCLILTLVLVLCGLASLPFKLLTALTGR